MNLQLKTKTQLYNIMFINFGEFLPCVSYLGFAGVSFLSTKLRKTSFLWKLDFGLYLSTLESFYHVFHT